MPTDRLFVEKGCPHCGAVVAVLNMEAAIKDDFRAPSGQALLVFSALSNDASIELLEKFGLAGKRMPVLVKHDGEVLENANSIISHLQQNNMAVK